MTYHLSSIGEQCAWVEKELKARLSHPRKGGQERKRD